MGVEKICVCRREKSRNVFIYKVGLVQVTCEVCLGVLLERDLVSCPT